MNDREKGIGQHNRKIDFTSRNQVGRIFERRSKDLYKVEDTMSKEELEHLHNNIKFTQRMFPEVLASNIAGALKVE